jgi:tetratricopeptide (TPR) repeat protein
MRASVCVLFLILASGVFAQTESLPQSLVPADPARLPGLAVTVPARQLLLPPKAVKELQRAQTAFVAGDIHSSARHLEKALEIYPECLEAHNNLGSRYIELREYLKAAAEFQKAIEIDPRVVQPVSNLSVALFLLERYPEAETASRRALDLDPRNATARYMLGAILATEKRNPLEAVNLLSQTKSQFANSRLLLAMVQTRLGNLEEAKNELREYLKAPDPAKKQNVERWLERLTQTSATNRATQSNTP